MGYTHTWHSVKLQKDENSLDSKMKLSSKELWCLTTLYGLIKRFVCIEFKRNEFMGHVTKLFRNCYETQSNGMLGFIICTAHWQNDGTSQFSK